MAVLYTHTWLRTASITCREIGERERRFLCQLVAGPPRVAILSVIPTLNRTGGNENSYPTSQRIFSGGRSFTGRIPSRCWPPFLYDASSLPVAGQLFFNLLFESLNFPAPILRNCFFFKPIQRRTVDVCAYAKWLEWCWWAKPLFFFFFIHSHLFDWKWQRWHHLLLTGQGFRERRRKTPTLI